MVEQKDSGESPYEKQRRHEIIQYIIDAKIGDPKYQAFFDYVALKYAQLDLSRHLSGMDETSPNRNGANKLRWESSLRIKEMKIALLEQSIHQKKIERPIYHTAIANLTSMLEEFSPQQADDIIIEIEKELYRQE